MLLFCTVADDALRASLPWAVPWLPDDLVLTAGELLLWLSEVVAERVVLLRVPCVLE